MLGLQLDLYFPPHMKINSWWIIALNNNKKIKPLGLKVKYKWIVIFFLYFFPFLNGEELKEKINSFDYINT